MKPAPPPPGRIERLFRWGVGIAIPVTIVAGLVLLLTARDPHGLSAPAIAAPPATHDVVLMAEPLEERVPSVLLTKPGADPCAADAVSSGSSACPPGRGSAR